MSATCVSCTLPVLWAVVEKSGRRMPLDPDPRSDGNVAIVRQDRHGTPTVRVLGNRAAAAHDGLLYRPHFASCPYAPHHRRPA